MHCATRSLWIALALTLIAPLAACKSGNDRHGEAADTSATAAAPRATTTAPGALKATPDARTDTKTPYAGKELSIATFNLLNLHEAGAPVYGRPMYDAASYEQKADWIGSQLKRMDADLVGFQEVWSAKALRDAVVRSGKYTSAQVHVPVERKDGPVVALATTLDVIEGPTAVAEFPAAMNVSTDDAKVTISSFSRPVLRATVALPDGTHARVYVAHLKSKRPTILSGEDKDDPGVKALGHTRSLLRRASEASALRWLVLEDMKGTRTPVIVIGDLNDGAASVTTRIIAGDEPYYALPMDKKREVWDVLMYSTYELQARQNHRDVYYTHIYNQRYETLDHILVSEELSGLGPNSVGRFTSLDVWNDHLNGHPPKTQSDHAQVVARFRMGR